MNTEVMMSIDLPQRIWRPKVKGFFRDASDREIKFIMQRLNEQDYGVMWCYATSKSPDVDLNAFYEIVRQSFPKVEANAAVNQIFAKLKIVLFSQYFSKSFLTSLLHFEENTDDLDLQAVVKMLNMQGNARFPLHFCTTVVYDDPHRDFVTVGFDLKMGKHLNVVPYQQFYLLIWKRKPKSSNPRLSNHILNRFSFFQHTQCESTFDYRKQIIKLIQNPPALTNPPEIAFPRVIKIFFHQCYTLKVLVELGDSDCTWVQRSFTKVNIFQKFRHRTG